MGLLDGKTAVIYGVANHRSIAWGIAEAMQREGARLALTYQGERVERYVRDLAASLTDPLVLPCDVTDDGHIDEVSRQIGATFGRLDAVVHSVAFAERDDLEGRFVDTSRRGFPPAPHLSAYSPVPAQRGALPPMPDGGLSITLTFPGRQPALPPCNGLGVAE